MRTILMALAPLTILAACGEAQEIPVTNTGNVILNDSLANESFANDEVVNTVAEDAADLNAAMDNGLTANEAILADEPLPSNGL